MNFIISIIRTLFRHRWLILVGTAIFTLLVFYYTRHMQGGYDVKATLYTGVASGYNLESDKRTDWATVQNSMDNLISIMQAESTLKRVFLRLFARVLIQGNPDNDNDGVTPKIKQLPIWKHICVRKKVTTSMKCSTTITLSIATTL